MCELRFTRVRNEVRLHNSSTAHHQKLRDGRGTGAYHVGWKALWWGTTVTTLTSANNMEATGSSARSLEREDSSYDCILQDMTKKKRLIFSTHKASIEAEDYNPERETRLLVLYTGGTIGMKVHDGGEFQQIYMYMNVCLFISIHKLFL